MTFKEDKSYTLNLLFRAYKTTWAGADIDDMVYDPETELVTVKFQGGATQKINVACDSCAAMIKDVATHLNIL